MRIEGKLSLRCQPQSRRVAHVIRRTGRSRRSQIRGSCGAAHELIAGEETVAQVAQVERKRKGDFGRRRPVVRGQERQESVPKQLGDLYSTPEPQGSTNELTAWAIAVSC